MTQHIYLKSGAVEGPYLIIEPSLTQFHRDLVYDSLGDGAALVRNTGAYNLAAVGIKGFGGDWSEVEGLGELLPAKPNRDGIRQPAWTEDLRDVLDAFGGLRLRLRLIRRLSDHYAQAIAEAGAAAGALLGLSEAERKN